MRNLQMEIFKSFYKLINGHTPVIEQVKVNDCLQWSSDPNGRLGRLQIAHRFLGQDGRVRQVGAYAAERQSSAVNKASDLIEEIKW